MLGAPISAETPIATGGGDANTNAEQKPTEQAEEKSYTAKELEAAVDRRIQQAREKIYAKASEEAREKLAQESEQRLQEADRQRLIESKNFEELSKKYQADIDALRAEQAAARKETAVTRLLSEKGLSEYADLFTSLSGSIEDVEKKIAAFVEIQDKAIGEKVKKQLNVAPPHKSQTTPTGGAPDPVSMSQEQWEAYKRERGIRII